VATPRFVAVRRGARGFGRTDGAAAAALVLYHHGLAQLAAQGLGHHAGDQVGGAARGEGHQQADGLVGVAGLGLGGRAEQGQQAQGECAATNHAFISCYRCGEAMACQ